MGAVLELSQELIAAAERPGAGIRAYTRDSLRRGTREDGSEGLLLRVDFNGGLFDLDVIEVDEHVRIAYLDENPETGHEALAVATAVEKARLLAAIHRHAISAGRPNGIEALFTIESQKSTPSARLAAQLFAAMTGADVPFEVLAAKRDRIAVAAHSVITPVEYVPVTAKKANIPKYLGVTESQASIIWDIHRRGRGMVAFLDDAYTTGASALAAQLAIREIARNPHMRIPKVVDIREFPFYEPYVPGGGYPGVMEDDIYAVRIFPEFIGAEPKPSSEG